MPILYFKPAESACPCGGKLHVHKTHTRTIASLMIGEFVAHITQFVCADCGHVVRAKEIDCIVSSQSKFSFDVIVYVGEALFIHHRSDVEIQGLLQEKNIAISLREIAYLGKKFIIYLALCHQACGEKIKHHMQSKGGYILHLDGTCEGDSPHLISSIDEMSRIVLDNIKVPSENIKQLIPYLEGLKNIYGTPIATVHDMSAAIIHAVESVFPAAKDFICHFHFLKDIGKDLFNFEYNTIRRTLKTYRTRTLLRQVAREFKKTIEQDNELDHYLRNYLKNQAKTDLDLLPTPVLIYLLVTWVLEARTESKGYGFPFDRPHLDFCRRLQEAYPKMQTLNSNLPPTSLKLPLTAISRTLNDQALKQTLTLIQGKITVFDGLREAMRIALPGHHRGLKDTGDFNIKTIEAQVNVFRDSDKIKQLAAQTIVYKKMVKQIDKYWNKLFADPIQIESNEGTIQIQPQRTNNIMETLFREIKRDGRKKTGTSSLSKTLKAMLANTPLVKNLAIPEYVEMLLNGKETLAERFAEMDIKLVRETLKQEDEDSRKYPKGMNKVFKILDFPEKLFKSTSKKRAAA